MNVFFLHSDFNKAAKMHCDKHVVKMILETAQMLSTAHRVLDGSDYANKHSLCNIAHINHPSTKWVRSGSAQYLWAYGLFVALLKEQQHRYGTTHKYWGIADALAKPPRNIPDIKFTWPPKCMPDEYKKRHTVSAYRAYYKAEKAYFASWKRASETPKWWLKAA